MRRLLILLAVLVAAFVAAPPSHAQQNDAQIAQALVGRWEWQGQMNGATVNYQLTLTGSGTFAFTSAMQTYQVTSTGAWQYQAGYLMFQTTWSSSLDPAGRPIGMSPIQILDVGPDYVRTPAGLARRTL